MRRWNVGRARLRLAGAGLAAVALMASPLSAGEAAFPGRAGRIAFAWDPDVSVRPQSCGDIFTIRPNGSGRTRLTRGCPWLYSDPAYSAGGNQIVFVRAHEPFPRHLHGDGIYVMDSDGSHIRRITTSRSDAEPAISPSGDWILFDRFRKHSPRSQLFLASTRGAGTRQLTHGQGAAEATFAPDGRRIAYVGGSNIFTMHLDGSHRHQLTRSSGRLDVWYRDPDFSPNGRLLAVACGEGDGFGSVSQICLMRSDGTHVRHLTPRPRLLAGDPVFSPDGREIAFMAGLLCGPPGCGDNDLILYTMRTDGSHLRRVYNLGPRQGPGSLGITWQALP